LNSRIEILKRNSRKDDLSGNNYDSWAFLSSLRGGFCRRATTTLKK